MILFLIVFSLMVYFEKRYEIYNSEISELSISKVNNFVSVSGFVESQSLYGDNLFVNFCSDLDLNKFENNKNEQKKNSSNCIKLVLFGAGEKLEKNVEYSAIGKITYHNNKLEIITRKIEIK
jgi:hypothetical protein